MKKQYLIWGAVALAVIGVVWAITNPPGGGGATVKGVKDVNNAEFKAAMGAPGVRIIDVRTPEEYEAGHIPGAENVPIDSLPQAAGSWDKTKPLLVYCATGARSLNAKQFLAGQGFTGVYNLTAGIASWDGEVLAGKDPGSASGGGGGSAQQGGADTKVTIATSGKPVMVDLYTDY